LQDRSPLKYTFADGVLSVTLPATSRTTLVDMGHIDLILALTARRGSAVFGVEGPGLSARGGFHSLGHCEIAKGRRCDRFRASRLSVMAGFSSTGKNTGASIHENQSP